MSTAPPQPPARRIGVLISALGGEGGGTLTQWLVDAARRGGFAAQSTSIPGVAQRTGATTYWFELARPGPAAAPRPVFSLAPVPGEVDVLLSSELVETARHVAAGFTSPSRTRVLTSTARSLTTQERIVPGDGRLDSGALLALVQAMSREHRALDMPGLARQAGTAVSAVMLGVLAGAGGLPIADEHYEAAIREAGGPGAAASLRGFAAGRAAAAGPAGSAALPAAGPARPPPQDTAQLVALGSARLTEYQDARCAAHYRERVQAVAAAERAAGGDAEAEGSATAEAARWLALWMAGEDLPRVAQLKARAARWQRIEHELRASPGDAVHVFEHFKPGVPELAGLLPAPAARTLLAWAQRRAARGLEPLAWPITLGSHRVRGVLLLRLVAALRHLRRFGQRHAAEQAAIERWLAAVRSGLARSRALGTELAACGRLVKGYGATNERAHATLAHVLRHLAPIEPPARAAAAVRAARDAALADASGRALDASLVQAGAPARPVREQPLRFVRRPATGGAAKAGTGPVC